ncbi:MAG: hypothetical protein ACR2QW_03725, partial [bacterium]
PLLLFFCLGIIARLRSQRTDHAGFWKFQATLFFVVSISQMYNLNTFLNHLTGMDTSALTGPPLSWIVTTIPLGTLFLYERNAGRMRFKRAVILATLLFLLYLIVYPDLEFQYRIEYLYFLFSSAVAYSCYQVLRQGQQYSE